MKRLKKSAMCGVAADAGASPPIASAGTIDKGGLGGAAPGRTRFRPTAVISTHLSASDQVSAC